MSIVALKRKTQVKLAPSSLNNARNTPSSSSAIRNIKSRRTNTQTFYLVPNMSASSNIEKNKGIALYESENCPGEKSTEPKNPIDDCNQQCTTYQNLDTDTNSTYIDKKKNRCLTFESKQKIVNIC